MERIVEQTLLYDFYGELLNEHQRGVHDLIKRVSNTLDGYEAKLHLVEKFMDTKAKITRIDELVDAYIKDEDMSYIHEIKKLSKEIIEDY